MRSQNGVSSIEVAMMFVVISIVAVVALPTLGKVKNTIDIESVDQHQSIQKVKSAYALAIAQTGDFPRLNDLVEFIDADFASQTNSFSGIIFRDGKHRLTVNTYRDTDCRLLTSNKEPGVTDVVRCI